MTSFSAVNFLRSIDLVDALSIRECNAPNRELDGTLYEYCASEHITRVEENVGLAGKLTE